MFTTRRKIKKLIYNFEQRLKRKMHLTAGDGLTIISKNDSFKYTDGDYNLFVCVYGKYLLYVLKYKKTILSDGITKNHKEIIDKFESICFLNIILQSIDNKENA